MSDSEIKSEIKVYENLTPLPDSSIKLLIENNELLHKKIDYLGKIAVSTNNISVSTNTNIIQIQDSLLKKNKKRKSFKKPLRNALSESYYQDLMKFAGSDLKREKVLKTIRLKLIFTILYYLGLRVNETRFLTSFDFEKAISDGYLEVLQTKTNTRDFRYFPTSGIQKLILLRNEIKNYFESYSYLGSSSQNKVYTSESFIRLINKEIKRISGICNWNSTSISSHSFRINFVSSLLKKHPVHNVRKFISHKNISSTLMYERYSVNQKEIVQDLDQVFK